MAHTTPPTSTGPAWPDRHPAGTSGMSEVTFSGVTLLCSWTEDEYDGILFESIWINGAWVDALALMGWEQFYAWQNAVGIEVNQVLDDEATAAEVDRRVAAMEAA